MSQLVTPYIGTRIDMFWTDRLVLTAEDTEKLINLLNKATIYRSGLSKEAAVVEWSTQEDPNSNHPIVKHSIITEEELALAKINPLIDP